MLDLKTAMVARNFFLIRDTYRGVVQGAWRAATTVDLGVSEDDFWDSEALNAHLVELAGEAIAKGMTHPLEPVPTARLESWLQERLPSIPWTALTATIAATPTWAALPPTFGTRPFALHHQVQQLPPPPQVDDFDSFLEKFGGAQ